MKIYIVVRVTRKYLTVYNHDINIRIIHIPVEEDDHEVINDDTSQDMRVTYTHHASMKDPPRKMLQSETLKACCYRIHTYEHTCSHPFSVLKYRIWWS